MKKPKEEKEEKRGAKPLNWKRSKSLPNISNASSKKFIARRFDGTLEDSEGDLSIIKLADWTNPEKREKIVERISGVLSSAGFRRYWQRHRRREAGKRKYHKEATGKFKRPEYDNAQFGFATTAWTQDGVATDYFGHVPNDFAANEDFRLSEYVDASIDYVFKKGVSNGKTVELEIHEAHWRWYRPGEL